MTPPLFHQSGSRRHILEFRDGGGFVSLNRRYYPPEVQRWKDPLDADRFCSPEDALAAIGNVFKERPENYRVRELQVGLADAEAPCESCSGEGRIDLNAGWHGPPNVERHHWHPCPECDGTGVAS